MSITLIYKLNLGDLGGATTYLTRAENVSFSGELPFVFNVSAVSNIYLSLPASKADGLIEVKVLIGLSGDSFSDKLCFIESFLRFSLLLSLDIIDMVWSVSTGLLKVCLRFSTVVKDCFYFTFIFVFAIS